MLGFLQFATILLDRLAPVRYSCDSECGGLAFKGMGRSGWLGPAPFNP